mmetsp:Transcript_22883/g.26333  ORF Transcript_22883/g.26333 Transcript_22883/m.26333 type:complete len:559 (+) Transcript_22883:62-1738(+)
MKIKCIIKSLITHSLTLSAVAQCSNMCSRHGTCNKSGVCICAKGFGGGDCSLRTCAVGAAFSDAAISTDLAHSGEKCSGRGICDTENGHCVCSYGFGGIACEKTLCANSCSNRGMCRSYRQFAEKQLSVESKRHTYENVWDSNKIYGCICDEGFSGYDCSIRNCPRGDDPLTPGGAQEVQLVRCSSDSGDFVLYFDGYPSTTINANGSKRDLKIALESIKIVHKINVDFSEGETICQTASKNIISITFLENFGPLPSLRPVIMSMDDESFIEVGTNRLNGAMTNDEGDMFLAVSGSKENNECSNRGLCDYGTGICACFYSEGNQYAGSDGYGNPGDRGDCGYPVVTISKCPGNKPCDGHGVCNSVTKRCDCQEGFFGGDCSLRFCEKGLSWFSYPSDDNVGHNKRSECSDMGICDRPSGECRCNQGFFGAACEYMNCGGEKNGPPCSGHGSCLSMRALGALTGQIVYGSDPNNFDTWDADRIHGCFCDEGYEGFDCSLKKCVKGLDSESLHMTVCSGHGTCNSMSGRCMCFRGWGSSNSNGAEGNKDDCGYRKALPRN